MFGGLTDVLSNAGAFQNGGTHPIYVTRHFARAGRRSLSVARDFPGCCPLFLDGRCNAGRDLIYLADDPGNLSIAATAPPDAIGRFVHAPQAIVGSRHEANGSALQRRSS
jgi:hypothetical protein